MNYEDKIKKQLLRWFMPAADYLIINDMQRPIRKVGKVILEPNIRLAQEIMQDVSPELDAALGHITRRPNRIRLGKRAEYNYDRNLITLEDHGDAGAAVVILAHELAHKCTPHLAVLSCLRHEYINNEMAPKVAEHLASQQLHLRGIETKEAEHAFWHNVENCIIDFYEMADGEYRAPHHDNHFYASLTAPYLFNAIQAKEIQYSDLLAIDKKDIFKKLKKFGATPNKIADAVVDYTLDKKLIKPAQLSSSGMSLA